MREKAFERILKSIKKDVVTPQDLKEKMLVKILMQKNNDSNLVMSKIEQIIFERPLRAACILSTIISGSLWAVMGNGYTGILSNIIGIR